ncbi:hypothetical protein [Modestobacter altitudinis]|uniref:hypothetical protein n=1 Tax=Modestobacter altitudinis TaxID=2213158 RepID=UPI00110C8E1A|nr:hypothetical protein [Modestobacter altitudinis]
MRSARRALARAVPWAAVLLPLAELLLVVTGVLPVGVAVLVAVVLEAAFAAVLVAGWTAFRRVWRTERARGGPRRQALLAGLAATAPPAVVTLVRSELGTWQALWWALRRRRAVLPGELAFGYTSRIGVMLWVTIALTPLEVLVVHLLLPWPIVRTVVLVLSIVSLVWMLGFALGLQQRPHVLGPGELVLRFGHLRQLVVPLADVVTARAVTTVDHPKNLEVADGQVALSVLGESSVRLQLRSGAVVGLDGRPVEAERVVFFADDPRAAVRELRARQAVGG